MFVGRVLVILYLIMIFLQIYILTNHSYYIQKCSISEERVLQSIIGIYSLIMVDDQHLWQQINRILSGQSFIALVYQTRPGFLCISVNSHYCNNFCIWLQIIFLYISLNFLRSYILHYSSNLIGIAVSSEKCWFQKNLN